MSAQVKTWKPTKENAQMHNKFVIIDDKLLLTGSFNWSFSAVNKNWENIMITGNPDIVNPYIDNFEQLWESS